MNKVLGVDIGFRSTGLALFDTDGDTPLLMKTECIQPKKDKDRKKKYVAIADMEHLVKMVRGLEIFIDGWRVKDIVVELPTGGARSSRAVRLMGMASAMIATIVVLKGLNVKWLTPKQIKQAACGKDSAEKDEIMAEMGKLYPSINTIPKCRREHIADAIACFIASRKD